VENLKYKYPDKSDEELIGWVEVELSTILSQEILQEINREVIRTVCRKTLNERRK